MIFFLIFFVIFSPPHFKILDLALQFYMFEMSSCTKSAGFFSLLFIFIFKWKCLYSTLEMSHLTTFSKSFNWHLHVCWIKIWQSCKVEFHLHQGLDNKNKTQWMILENIQTQAQTSSVFKPTLPFRNSKIHNPPLPSDLHDHLHDHSISFFELQLWLGNSHLCLLCPSNARRLAYSMAKKEKNLSCGQAGWTPF